MKYKDFIAILMAMGYNLYGPEPQEPHLELWWKGDGIWFSQTVYIDKAAESVQIGCNFAGAIQRTPTKYSYQEAADRRNTQKEKETESKKQENKKVLAYNKWHLIDPA